MILPETTPKGDTSREAIASLGGYVYQIYQSAIAWTELKDDEFLYLEVAEDYAVVASNALQAVQVKKTAKPVTINSNDIVALIDSFVELQENNSGIKVYLRYLTTSGIGKEKSNDHRIGDKPTLISWRNLAKTGDLSDLRRILRSSKISAKSKTFIDNLCDFAFRENFLKRIHFDCDSSDLEILSRQLKNRISKLLIERGGFDTQVVDCIAKIIFTLLNILINKNRNERRVGRCKLENLIAEFTQRNLNKIQIEEMIRSTAKALSASASSGNGLLGSPITNISLVSEVPLPNALANRNTKIKQLLNCLEREGVCWITGAAGMGKTVAARVLAHKHEGAWGSINLRGQTSEQVSNIIAETTNMLPTLDLRGLVVDDLDCQLKPIVLENLHYLVHSANRSDVLLIVASCNPPTSDFLFVSNLQSDIVVALTEFTKEDIEEILDKFGITDARWVKYVYLASGCGHPQLAVALIQNMDASHWNSDEFLTLNALIPGSPAIEEVRKRTRERLRNDLPDSSRRLIERLSLNVGTFSRELAVDLGNVTPPIPDAGIILESLVNSWIDQHEGDRFSLSQLISNFASKTLPKEEIVNILIAISDSLTKGPNFNPIDIDSAMLAAWKSKNEAVIRKICGAILYSGEDELQLLAPLCWFFTIFGINRVAYPTNPEINHLYRGVQVLLLNQQTESFSKLQETLACFAREALDVEHDMKRISMNFLIYSKLLLQTSKARLGTKFIDVISQINQLLENSDDTLSSKAQASVGEIKEEWLKAIGIMFLNQARQLTKIAELNEVFDFLNECTPELRERILAPFESNKLGFEALVKGPWLCEYHQNSVKPDIHSAAFARFEKQAVSWKVIDLAICCRKFMAMILYDYGNNKEGALKELDRGLNQYELTNCELLLAKARIRFQSRDYKESLAIYRPLIESDSPFSNVEKAFLCREAAISAERERDLNTARRYYLYARDATKETNLPSMTVMGFGLLGDAALASWRVGDRLKCLQDFVVLLKALSNFKHEETPRTSYCHAITHLVLILIYQDIKGNAHFLDESEGTKIYPGCFSNPEPHPDFDKGFIPPIEMAWYKLAEIENYALLDAGITKNLDKFLPNGSVIEGQCGLAFSKLHKALETLDKELFVGAMKENISCVAFTQKNNRFEYIFNSESFNYGSIPEADEEQQSALCKQTEHFVLLFCTNCIFKGSAVKIDSIAKTILGTANLPVRPELFWCLQRVGLVSDFNTYFAQLIYRVALAATSEPLEPPFHVFEFAFNYLRLAQRAGVYTRYAGNILPWLRSRWDFVWNRQRFLLNQPLLHEYSIKTAFERNDIVTHIKIAKILLAILPTLEIENRREASRILLDLSRQ